MTAAAVVSHARAAKPKPKPPTYTPPYHRKCTHKCPGGNVCICSPDNEHFYHICKNEDCACHSQYVPFPDPEPRPKRRPRAIVVGAYLDLFALLSRIRADSVRLGARRHYPSRAVYKRSD